MVLTILLRNPHILKLFFKLSFNGCVRLIARRVLSKICYTYNIQNANLSPRPSRLHFWAPNRYRYTSGTKPRPDYLFSDYLMVTCNLILGRPGPSVKHVFYKRIKGIDKRKFKDDILRSHLLENCAHSMI